MPGNTNSGRKASSRWFNCALGVLAAASLMTSVSNASSLPPTYQVTSQSATFKIQHAINYATEGQAPQALVAGPSNVQYGLAVTGGIYGSGALVQISPAGSYSVAYSFTAGEGLPSSTLVVATDGTALGGTQETVSNGVQVANGEVFEISSTGTHTVLHTFAPVSNPENSNPSWWAPYFNADGNGYSRVTQAADGTIYGTKSSGGANGMGTVYRIGTDGSFTILHTFSAVDPDTYANGDGATPSYAPGSLMVAADGSVYGLTEYGGTNGLGVVFKITVDGSYSVLCNIQSANPSGLLLGADGNLYGWTRYAVQSGGGTTNGTVFRLTPAGQFTSLYTPATVSGYTTYVESLLQAPDGNFYGTLYSGSSSIFKLTPDGASTVLHQFDMPSYAVGCSIGCGKQITSHNFDGIFATLIASIGDAIY